MDLIEAVILLMIYQTEYVYGKSIKCELKCVYYDDKNKWTENINKTN